jgi:uroporphyrinogen III methyltransferase/synthase
MNYGVIYLVGTGPGEVGLITAKGLALVREADAIVGDLRSQAQLLQQARPEAELHDVGCRTSQSKLSQPEINRLLIDLARQGKMVARLWPGDPFVFGRAAQEIAAARQAGLRIELVPGVTSAIAAPAYAGAPVTHWEYAVSFAVVTGYESKNPNVRANWTALAGIDTLVIMMPLDNLAEIVNKLLAAGRSPDTPALAVQHGTLPHQKQVLATLATLEAAVKSCAIENPAIVVVGEVAKLSPELNWFQPETMPLLGQRVLVTRPAHQSADFIAALRALGADPISFPTIEIKPAADTTALDEAIRKLGDWRNYQLSIINYQLPYNWLVLTSANGVAAFWDGLARAGLDSRCLAPLKIAAIGPATAESLKRRGITPDLIPGVYTAEGILDAFDRLGPAAGQRFLLARADIARKTLADGLQARGALVEEIATYQTAPIQNGAPPPQADIVTFTSSSTVQGYVNCLQGRPPAEVLRHSRVVCIGPITASTAERLGVPVSAVAEKYTIEGVLEALKTMKES